MGFPVEGFISGMSYRPQGGDIFVSTYPKCGTTWMQYIVYLILHNGRGIEQGRNINDVFPHLEEVGSEAVAALAQPRLIKTHLPFERTPWHSEAKYIYVARNPFDCVVSFYHHTRGFVRHYDYADGTFDDFFECFISGEVDFGDYFDNLLSWYPHKNDANVLFTTYESLVADTRAGVVAVGEFLGEAFARTVRDPKVLARILEESSFQGMRENQGRWSSERPSNMPEFVRKGVVGDWENYFSPEQTRRLVAKLEQRTRGTGAERLWPGVLAAAKQRF